VAELAAPEPAEPPSIAGFLQRRWLAILIPTLIAAGAALAFSLQQEKEYEASTSILFRDSGIDGRPVASQDPEREAATNVRLLQLDFLINRVSNELDQPFTGEVDVVAEAESNLATITVTDTHPARAADVANAFAREYIDLREQTTRADIEREQEAIQQQLAALPQNQRQGPQGEALNGRLKELDVASTTAAAGARQFSRAVPPSSAVSPKPVRNAILGGLIGLVLGIALAIWLERRDRLVRDPHEIEHVFGRPIIGKIPRSRTLAKAGPGTAALPPVEAEAFRTVRANLRHHLRASDARSVLVTSANPREGKTTVVWNLARMEAASGARVLLVEADMRRPVLAKRLGVNGAAGLHELLAGNEQLQNLVQPVRFEDRGNGSEPPVTVDVLFAGTPPSNPAELLDSDRMQAVLEVLPGSYDLVVLDTPPASVVSDAMPIFDLVGGVVVVGRIGFSTHDAITELRDQLRNLDAPTVGVVVNADSISPRSYRYYQRAGRG
jgi:succinoglycan biosynthesis transport protein ExoP